ncbi:MAG: hypothetical protein ABIN89_18490, partial [Chitinophagaceae bacterium]
HAFVSASTVLIESYSRGLKCFTGYYVNNQKFIYDGFVHEKMAIGLGDFRLLNNTSITYALSNQGELSLLHTSLLSGHNILESFQSLAARCN